MKTRTRVMLACLAAGLSCVAATASAAIVGAIFEDQQNKWPASGVGADGYSLTGYLEDSFQTPVYVSQFNGQIAAPGGPIIPPPGGNTFNSFNEAIAPVVPPPGPFYNYSFTAQWWNPNQNVAFGTWWRFGVYFDTGGTSAYQPTNFAYSLSGAWTQGGVDPSPNPLYGFSVPPTEDSLTLYNQTVPSTIQSMQMMILSASDAIRLPPSAVGTSAFQSMFGSGWKMVPTGSLSWSGTIQGTTGYSASLTVPFSAVSGMRDLHPGEMLVAQISSTANGVDPIEYVIHGANNAPTLWTGGATPDLGWSNAGNWARTVTPISELQFGAAAQTNNFNNLPAGSAGDGDPFPGRRPELLPSGQWPALGRAGAKRERRVSDHRAAADADPRWPFFRHHCRGRHQRGHHDPYRQPRPDRPVRRSRPVGEDRAGHAAPCRNQRDLYGRHLCGAGHAPGGDALGAADQPGCCRQWRGDDLHPEGHGLAR